MPQSYSQKVSAKGKERDLGHGRPGSNFDLHDLAVPEDADVYGDLGADGVTKLVDVSVKCRFLAAQCMVSSGH